MKTSYWEKFEAAQTWATNEIQFCFLVAEGFVSHVKKKMHNFFWKSKRCNKLIALADRSPTG